MFLVIEEEVEDKKMPDFFVQPVGISLTSGLSNFINRERGAVRKIALS
jgi:hypothetical protein